MQEFTIAQIDKRPSLGSESNSVNGGVLVFNNRMQSEADNPYAAGPIGVSSSSGRLTPTGRAGAAGYSGGGRPHEFIIR